MKVIVDNTELRVGFKHEEFRDADGSPSWIHHRTTCTVWETVQDQEPQIIARGSADCCGLDNFKKETGRKIALSRAIAQLDLPKAERAEIWQQYHMRGVDGNHVEERH